jgi:hypothetical protein
MRIPFLMKDECGAITAMTVIMLAAFVGLLALVIDLGHLQTVQNELQNAADACALRGARAFVPDTMPLNNTDQLYAAAPDANNAVSQASSTIGANDSDNVALTDLPTTDIQVGIWDYETSNWLGGTPSFTWPPPSEYWGHYIGPGIGLTTRRANSYNYGPVGMTLARFFGYNQVDVKTPSIAALSGVGAIDTGAPVLPFGPRHDLYDQYLGNPDGLLLNPDETGTMGWTNLDPGTNTSAEDIMKIFNDGALTYCQDGETVSLQNGVASSCIQTMIQPNNRFGLAKEPGGAGYSYQGASPIPGSLILQQDGYYYLPNGGRLPLYMMPTFDMTGNIYNQAAVTHFIPVQILEVKGPPNNTIKVYFPNDPTQTLVAPNTYGGGAWYGILSTQPKLVK